MPINLADLSSRPWARSGSHNGKGGFIRPPTRCPPSPDNFQKGFPPQLRSRVKTGYPDVCRGYLPAPQRRPSVPTSLWRGTPPSPLFLSLCPHSLSFNSLCCCDAFFLSFLVSHAYFSYRHIYFSLYLVLLIFASIFSLSPFWLSLLPIYEGRRKFLWSPTLSLECNRGEKNIYAHSCLKQNFLNFHYSLSLQFLPRQKEFMIYIHINIFFHINTFLHIFFRHQSSVFRHK